MAIWLTNLWAFKPFLFTVDACAWNLQLKVDESAGLSHSSGTNKITTEQVNFPFIGPHSGASFWRFPLNRFCLRITPRLATRTMVYIPQPLFTFICCAPSRSRIICDCWLISPLFLRRQIRWHVSNSAERRGLIHRASFCSRFIHNRRCNLPLFLCR